MNIFLSPQRNDCPIKYTFQEETIKMTYKGITDIVDLTTFPEGAEFQEMETTLEVAPVLDVKRENGELQVTLLNFIGGYASQEEKFPTWESSEEIQKRYDETQI